MSTEPKVSNPTELVIITGSTRSGESTLAKLFATFAAPSEKVCVIHQDDCFRDPKEMPKVSLQGAPFVKITYWDDDSCIDWSELMLRVNAALTSDQPPTMLIVEGNMLVSCKPLMKAATSIVVLSIDKWTCFDRRVESGSKRQCYLPYMIRMWESHKTRFANVRGDVFLSQQNLRNVGSGVFSSAKAVLNSLFSYQFSRENFLDELQRNELYSPHHTPVVVANNNSVYGVELAKKLTVDSMYADQIDKIHGMLLGNALGDASGAWCEFHHGKKVEWSDGLLTIPLVLSGRSGVRAAPPGAVTDDFQMTFLVLKHLVENKFSFVPTKQIKSYIRWASSLPGGIGTNTRDLFQHPVIKNEQKTFEKYVTAHASKHGDPNALSMSNGTLMRASAFAVCPDRKKAILNAVADARVSNNNPTNICANAIYVAFAHDLVRSLVHDLDLHVSPVFMFDVQEVLLDAKIMSDLNDASFTKVREVVYHACSSPFYDAKNDIGDMSKLVNDKDKKGFVLVALWVAFRYFTKWMKSFSSTRTSFRHLIRDVVCLGGDTDTNAAIVGALVGAWCGANYLRVQEEANLEVLLNVEYRYSTVKNIDNLTPAALPPYIDKLYDLYHGIAIQSENNNNNEDDDNNTSTDSASTSSKRKHPNDEDDDDDEKTEEFLEQQIVQKEKSAKLVE